MKLRRRRPAQHVFVGNQDVPPDAERDYERFIGSFSVFAPRAWWGVDDHCDWQKPPVSASDRRPPHRMTPINISMEITEALARLADRDEFTVTVPAARRGDPAADEGVPRFERLSVLAYQ